MIIRIVKKIRVKDQLWDNTWSLQLSVVVHIKETSVGLDMVQFIK